jgi:hypothetical protein
MVKPIDLLNPIRREDMGKIEEYRKILDLLIKKH